MRLYYHSLLVRADDACAWAWSKFTKEASRIRTKGSREEEHSQALQNIMENGHDRDRDARKLHLLRAQRDHRLWPQLGDTEFTRGLFVVMLFVTDVARLSPLCGEPAKQGMKSLPFFIK